MKINDFFYSRDITDESYSKIVWFYAYFDSDFPWFILSNYTLTCVWCKPMYACLHIYKQ